MTLMAAIQMRSGDRIEKNLADAERLVKSAVDQGAQWVVLPENFALLATEKLYPAGLEEIHPKGPIRSFVSGLAKRYGIWIVAGSIPVTVRPDNSPVEGRVRAVCFVYDSQGKEVARYDKIHLFDVQVDDQYGSYMESESIEPGDAVKVLDTPFGRLGLTICYDLRFPELFRLLCEQGAEIITVPSAFTAVTGAAHWELLLRSRAVENLCYLVGADQSGRHSETRQSFGHSMIVNPWGEVLARKPRGPGVVMADIDLSYLAELRKRMPVSEHRRF